MTRRSDRADLIVRLGAAVCDDRCDADSAAAMAEVTQAPVTETKMPDTAYQEPTAMPQPAVPLHDARKLVGDGATAQIKLGASVYTLRITRAGKLILTK